jgi:uncharacterized protein
MPTASPVITAGRRARLDELCRRFRVEILYLFGSAAAGDFREDSSDLDFLVRFQPATPREHADHYFGLLEELENLFGRPIDLVEEEAIRNPYLRDSIESSRHLIYEAA